MPYILCRNSAINTHTYIHESTENKMPCSLAIACTLVRFSHRSISAFGTDIYKLGTDACIIVRFIRQYLFTAAEAKLLLMRTKTIAEVGRTFNSS